MGRWPLALAAVLALLVKLAVPAGYMPGTSLAAPILLCPDQGGAPAAAAAHHGHHVPAKAPDKAEHPCAFAGLGVAPLAALTDDPRIAVAPLPAEPPTTRPVIVLPGRGLAAPPPPSHGPPATHV